ncbi:hypothetical protein ACFL0I_02600 [Gemmatimonadota bacterium]
MLLILVTAFLVVYILPHRVRARPEVTGVVSQEGVPVAGIELRLVNPLADETCASEGLVAITDSLGAFQFPDSMGWGLPRILGHADKAFRWTLCLLQAEVWNPVYEGLWGIGPEPPPRDAITCEFDEHGTLACSGEHEMSTDYW